MNDVKLKRTNEGRKGGGKKQEEGDVLMYDLGKKRKKEAEKKGRKEGMMDQGRNEEK